MDKSEQLFYAIGLLQQSLRTDFGKSGFNILRHEVKDSDIFQNIIVTQADDPENCDVTILLSEILSNEGTAKFLTLRDLDCLASKLRKYDRNARLWLHDGDYKFSLLMSKQVILDIARNSDDQPEITENSITDKIGIIESLIDQIPFFKNLEDDEQEVMLEALSCYQKELES